jgi:hypothetical protein
MKMRYLNKFALLAFAVSLFFSCNDKPDTEFGNSKIYFSNTKAAYTLKDSATLSDLALRPDTTVNFVGIYRSGVVDNYEAITIKIEIDSAYLAGQIAAAQTASASEMTDIMIRYKNAKALGAYYSSIPTTVVIAQGERKITLPITLRKAVISLYNNAVFNYSKTDYANSSVLKDKMLVLPFKIISTSPELPLLETNQRCFVEITKQITIAN